jgi:hypothetical protein
MHLCTSIICKQVEAVVFFMQQSCKPSGLVWSLIAKQIKKENIIIERKSINAGKDAIGIEDDRSVARMLPNDQLLTYKKIQK